MDFPLTDSMLILSIGVPQRELYLFVLCVLILNRGDLDVYWRNMCGIIVKSRCSQRTSPIILLNLHTQKNPYVSVALNTRKAKV